MFQILTFPVENKEDVCKEYLLPQLCTEYFYRKDYLEIVYQSTKSTDIFQGSIKYSQRDYNYCFFVSEKTINNYDEELLRRFYTVKQRVEKTLNIEICRFKANFYVVFLIE